MRDEVPRKSTTGPGCVMVVAIIGGTIIGMRSHQATIGLLSGIGAAVLIVGLLWAWDRMR